MASQKGRSVVQFNLLDLKRKLELAKGRRYRLDEIAQAAALHPNTLYGMSSNTSKRVDLNTLAKLLDFFNDEGLTINPGDLFVVESLAESEEQSSE